MTDSKHKESTEKMEGVQRRFKGGILKYPTQASDLQSFSQCYPKLNVLFDLTQLTMRQTAFP